MKKAKYVRVKSVEATVLAKKNYGEDERCMEPINVLMDAAVVVEATYDSELRKSDLPQAFPALPVSRSGESQDNEAEDDDDEKSTASDEDNKGEDTTSD